MIDPNLRVGITGAEGLVGWHVRCYLHSLTNATVVPANRETFESDASLDAFVAECDVIAHFAGMNRGDDDEFMRVNLGLAQQLVDAFERNHVTPRVIYSSSIQADADNYYGRSKKAADDCLAQWAEKSGAGYSSIVLPNIFGECGKPFYNSVVSTFCELIAHNQPTQVHEDREVPLMHAQQVGELVVRIINENLDEPVRPQGHPMRVSAIRDRLIEFREQYVEGAIPDLRSDFDVRLFNTYRSYLYPEFYPKTLKINRDDRGHLFEAVKSLGGGQTFLSTTKPGITRGNHYHLKKIERFLVLEGQAVIRIRRMFSDETREFFVSGEEPVFLDMPTCHTHSISNTGSGELVTLFWANEIFDPEAPDTRFEPVMEGEA